MRQRDYGAPSSGPISLTAPGVAPDEDDIDLPPAGTPGSRQGVQRNYPAPYTAPQSYPPRDRYSQPYPERPRCAGAAAGAKPAAARAGTGQFRHRLRAGRGQAGGDAGLSDRLGARSLAHGRRAAGRAALVRRARRRDQADLGLFLPRHERQFARAYFRARLRQCAGYRRLHARRRPARFGEGRLEGHAGRAGLPARRAGRRLPAIHHRAGAGLQRLSLRSHPRRSDAPRRPPPDLRAIGGIGRGDRRAGRASQSLCVARAVRDGIARRRKTVRIGARRPGATRTTGSRTIRV